MIVSSMASGETPARDIAARAATSPSSGAERAANDPPNLPIGVRTAPAMNTVGARFIGPAYTIGRRRTPADTAACARCGGPASRRGVDLVCERPSRYDPADD